MVAALAFLLASGAFAGQKREIVDSDPRAELAAAVELLAAEERPDNTPGFQAEGSRYGEELGRFVAPFRDHPCVKAFRRLRADGFQPDEFLFLAFQRLDRETLQPRRDRDFQDPLESVHADIGAFVELAADFAKTSRFRAWLDEHRPSLDAEVRRERTQLEKLALRRRLERYAGLETRVPLRIVICPTFQGHSSGFYTEDGRPMSVTFFGRADFSLSSVFLWQEMAHAALDHLAHENEKRVARVRLSDRQKMLCGSNQQCVSEMVARAVALHLYKRDHGGAMPVSDVLAAHHRPGRIPYDPAVLKLEAALGDYDADRKKYPSLKEFYPRLLDVFDAS